MSEHLLDTQHAEHLVEYLRFLRRKRDQCVSEIAAEFKELLLRWGVAAGWDFSNLFLREFETSGVGIFKTHVVAGI